MPCRSDYMEPTAQEKGRVRDLTLQAKNYLDAVAYGLDLTRERVVSEPGLRVTENLGFAKNNLKEARARRTQLQKEYAFRGDAALDKEIARLAGSIALIQKYDDAVVNKRGFKGVLKQIEKEQIEHRKKDIARICQVFLERKDFPALVKAAQADPTMPLEPQLGYDPDVV